MPLRKVEIPDVPETVVDGVHRLQEELELRTEFPAAVLQHASGIPGNEPDGPQRVDATDIEFIAIDPPTSMDLDQIMHIERDGDGYVVHYGIADIPAFVPPNSPIDQEAHLRGQTFYAPGARLPLHPVELSEDAASLLADGRPRPVYLWTLTLDAKGELTSTRLDKAMVVNRAKLNYEGVQEEIDEGRGHPTLALLKEVGELRLAIEEERGGVSLNLPEQEIVPADGTWELEFRTLLPVEDWNAQISLLTGIAAAHVMLEGKVGILRTLPPAEERDINKLRRSARALGVDWPNDMPYAEFVRSLEPTDPRQLAVLFKCILLFRGASYLAFNGEVPDENIQHAALATPYAHTTAPLRRLVDKYVLEICWCLLNDVEIPRWVSERIESIPQIMDVSNRKASAYERRIVDLAEALVLGEHVGERFQAALVDVVPTTGKGTYQISDPAVEVRIPDADKDKLGEMVTVEVVSVDLVAGSAELRVVD